MSNKKKIIWIVSYPKSGNTWIRIALNLALTGSIDLNKIQINSFSGLMKYYIKRQDDLSKPGDVAKFWTNAQKSIVGEIPENSFKALKTHNVCAQIGDVKFPDYRYTAGIIYIVRDPRDVAVSYSSHFNMNIEETIFSMMKEDHFIFNSKSLYRSELISSWDKHVISWVSSKFPKLVLRYEDLLSNTHGCFKALFDFCNVKPKINIDDIVQLSSFKKLSILEKEKGFVEANRYGASFFRSGKTKVWKEYPEEIFKPVTIKFNKVMEKFNYV